MIGNFNDENSRSVFHGFLAMQRPEVEQAFKEFIEREKPTLIVEIGTAFGGLAMALHKNALNAKFITFDIYENSSSHELYNHDVDFRVENIFYPVQTWNEPYRLRSNIKKEFNKYKSPRLFLCDGGSKISEYNCLAKFLRSGDILMAHDFAYNEKFSKINLDEGVWAWSEIMNCNIIDVMQQNSISYYDMRTWEKLAWACTKKD